MSLQEESMFDNANPATAAQYDAALAEAAPASGARARPEPAGANVFAPLPRGGATAGQPHDIELVLDIPVQLTVELGRTRVPLRDVLELAQGSVIELDGLAGEPLDVLVNGCLIARGEVVVVNERFGLRLTDIVTPAERFRKPAR
jgi:flagellar motor switch protein FliN/FliY